MKIIYGNKRLVTGLLTTVLACSLLWIRPAAAAPAADLRPRWQVSAENSIMDVDISPGFFSNGPWDAKLLIIEGKKLSLNDIEHRILRPIFTDNRVHYALNCASLGCPNLQPKPFTAADTEQLLSEGAKSYINHFRGAQTINGKVKVSSIYKWFQADFGGSEQKGIDHLLLYAQDDLAQTLHPYKKKLSFDYNWNLNE